MLYYDILVFKPCMDMYYISVNPLDSFCLFTMSVFYDAPFIKFLSFIWSNNVNTNHPISDGKLW